MDKRVLMLLVPLVVMNGAFAKKAKKQEEVCVISEEKISDYRIHLSGVTFGKEFTGYGSSYLQNITTQKMTIKGDVAIKESTVLGEASIKGEMAAHHTTFSGLVQVDGPVAASSSTFKDKLVGLSKILLVNCTVQDIVIEPENEGEEGQLYLQGKNTVKGTIIFRSGSGKVYTNSTTKIHGLVIGGRIIKQ